MILIGINSSGLIHFGNYLSIIKPVFFLKNINIFIADLHSISKNISILNILKNKIILISVFLTFFKNLYFYQSFNEKFLKFFWILLCFYNKNKMKLFHSLNNKKIISFGKICYPILMCTDIICNYNNYIFVGLDQLQHIELYKKIKKKINYLLNFKIIKNSNFIINNNILYSFDKKKMSKSNKNDLFVFSNFNQIFFFLKKFKFTKKKKKSILNFSINILNNNFIKKIFFNLNNEKFIQKISELIYFKFLPFKKKFIFNLKNIDSLILKLNLNNKYYKNIVNNNIFNLFKNFNL
ncbi:hypothetical protein [Candidatus Carsonella ruddii]|uniref:tryptophan--tRNA ligase n=2 Tax=Carsonella ruddii TaxID=114186 RepID=A0A1U9RRZ2_CARRU|nr:hypothetical protein [Candidatus Carsonella ruddii]AQU89549.1 Tryptophanyl-tRNA synthetase [Candidatus Carsonella ruddii]